jgi:glycosyl transferase family 87
MRRAAVVFLLLVLSAVYVGTGIQQNLLVAAAGFTNGIRNGVGTDFPAFYAASLEARAGRANAVYDTDALQAAHEAVRGVEVKRYAWAYPPTVLLLLLPLSLLPLVPALWTWLGVTTAALVAAACRILPSPLTPVLVLLFPGVATSVVTGPTGTFTAAVVAGGFAFLDRRPVLAGLVLGLSTVKPHMAVLVPLCLLAARMRAAVLGFLVSAAGLGIASVAAWGLSPWLAFWQALPRHMALVAAGDLPWMRMPTAFVAVHHAIGGTALAWAAQAGAGIAVMLACAWIWRRSDDPVARSLVLTAGIPLAGPYAYDYDTCALVVPTLYLAREMIAGRVRSGDTAILLTLWLTPVALWLVSTALGQQIGPVLLGALVAAAVRRAARGAADEPSWLSPRASSGASEATPTSTPG